MLFLEQSGRLSGNETVVKEKIIKKKKNDGTLIFPGERLRRFVNEVQHSLSVTICTQPNCGNDREQDGVAVPAMPKRGFPLLCVSVGAAHVMLGKSYCDYFMFVI